MIDELLAVSPTLSRIASDSEAIAIPNMQDQPEEAPHSPCGMGTPNPSQATAAKAAMTMTAM